MEAGGWKFLNINYDMPSNYLSACGDKTWYGFKYPRIGNIGANFTGTGTAILDYGNCHTNGQTNVELNGRLVDTVEKNTPSKQIIFDFAPGDSIQLNELNEAIIKLNSLTLKCKSE